MKFINNILEKKMQQKYGEILHQFKELEQENLILKSHIKALESKIRGMRNDFQYCYREQELAYQNKFDLEIAKIRYEFENGKPFKSSFCNKKDSEDDE